MKRIVIVSAMTGLLLAMLVGPASAKGVSIEKLERAGWVCVDQGNDAPTPCLPHGEAVLAGEAAASIIMTFGPDGTFWGTEHLIHHDLYNGQPCPQDEVEGGDGSYIDLEDVNGLTYFVCHHFDSPVT